MFCKNCGAECADGVKFCEKCGTAMDQPVYQTPVANNSFPGKGMGIASMVLGIVALVLFCIFYISIPCGIVGLVLGALAYKKARAVGVKSNIITAGIVCSCVALGIEIIYLGLAMIGIVSSTAGLSSLI